jgi:elongation factor 2
LVSKAKLTSATKHSCVLDRDPLEKAHGITIGGSSTTLHFPRWSSRLIGDGTTSPPASSTAPPRAPSPPPDEVVAAAASREASLRLLAEEESPSGLMHPLRLHVANVPRFKDSAAACDELLAELKRMCASPLASRLVDCASASLGDGAISARLLLDALEGAAVVESDAPPGAGLGDSCLLSVRCRARGNSRIEGASAALLSGLYSLWKGLSDSADEAVLVWGRDEPSPRPLSLELPRASARSQLAALCGLRGWSHEFSLRRVAGDCDDASVSSSGSTSSDHRFVCGVVIHHPRTGLITTSWPGDPDLARSTGSCPLPSASAEAGNPSKQVVCFSSARDAREAAAKAALADIERASEMLSHRDASPESSDEEEVPPPPSLGPRDLVVNLIDCPGHAQFGFEVAAALRAADGALLVVDAVEGICPQTQFSLLQAIRARVRPVLVVNKIDRLALELKVSPRDVCRKFVGPLVAKINALVVSQTSRFKWRSPPLSIADGSVVLTSGALHFACSSLGAAVSAARVAARDVVKSGGESAAALVEKAQAAALDAQGSVLAAFDKSPLSALEKFCVAPLFTLMEAVQCVVDKTGDEALAASKTLDKALRRATALASVHEHDLVALLEAGDSRPSVRLPGSGSSLKEAFKTVLSKLFPLADTLLESVAARLPSPELAQTDRAPSFLELSADESKEDEALTNVSLCDPARTLVAFVTKFIDPTGGARNVDELVAVVRVLSGTLRPGDRIRAWNEGEWTSTTVKGVLELSGGTGLRLLPLAEGARAGDLVAVSGIAADVTRPTTLTGSDNDCVLKPLWCMLEPVTSVAVRAVGSGGRALSVAQARRIKGLFSVLARTDPMLKVLPSDVNSQFELCGAGELHLQVAISRLQAHSGLTFQVSPPKVDYAETISAPPPFKTVTDDISQSLSVVPSSLVPARVALGRSSNGHVRLWITAEPLPADFFASKPPLPCESPCDTLCDAFGWKRDAARRVWGAGPREHPTCLIADCTSGSAHLHAIKDSVLSAFEDVVRRGPVCFQPVQNVMFRIIDAAVHAEQTHRGASQVVPAAARAMNGAFLAASPLLLESTSTLLVDSPTEMSSVVYDFASAHAATVVDVSLVPDDADSTQISMDIPRSQLLALDDLVEATKGRCTMSLRSGGWRRLDGDPLARSPDGGSAAASSARASAGWGVTARFVAPNPARVAAEVVSDLRERSPCPTASEVADAIGLLR